MGKKQFTGLFPAVVLGALLICAIPASAQDEFSLDDYLTEEAQVQPTPEPAQESLSNVVEDATGLPLPNIDDDALPDIPALDTRDSPGMTIDNGDMRLQTGGVNPAEKTPEELQQEIRREAYDAAITGLFPLTTDNIRTLLRRNDEVQRAVEEPINGIPTPRVNVETISLDPGVTPMVITTSPGYITTLNILDVTGAPWPIQDIGWAGDFEVIEPEEGGHIVRISPLGNSAYGNMSVRLLTLKTPITIQLKTDKNDVQYRVDARIPEYGPFASTPLIEGGGGIQTTAGNSTIMSILDGVSPGNAQRLDVSGVDGRTSAYRLNNMVYVRTPLTLLSPGWKQSVSSADGMKVYALEDTPVLLLSDNGRFTRVNLKVDESL